MFYDVFNILYNIKWINKHNIKKETNKIKKKTKFNIFLILYIYFYMEIISFKL